MWRHRLEGQLGQRPLRDGAQVSLLGWRRAATMTSSLDLDFEVLDTMKVLKTLHRKSRGDVEISGNNKFEHLYKSKVRQTCYKCDLEPEKSVLYIVNNNLMIVSVSCQPAQIHRGSSESFRHRAEEKLRPLQRGTHPCECSEHRHYFYSYLSQREL